MNRLFLIVGCFLALLSIPGCVTGDSSSDGTATPTASDTGPSETVRPAPGSATMPLETATSTSLPATPTQTPLAETPTPTTIPSATPTQELILKRLDERDACELSPLMPSSIPEVGSRRGNDHARAGIGGASAATRTGEDGVLYITDLWDFERDGWFQLKMLLYIQQESRTDMLVRLKQLDGDGTGASTYYPDGVSTTTLNESRANELPDDWWHWTFLPTISAYGCYGMQFDTPEWSEQIIFEILPSKE